MWKCRSFKQSSIPSCNTNKKKNHPLQRYFEMKHVDSCMLDSDDDEILYKNNWCSRTPESHHKWSEFKILEIVTGILVPTCLSRYTTETISVTVRPNLALSPEVPPQCPLCLVLSLARTPMIGRIPSRLLQETTSSSSSICQTQGLSWIHVMHRPDLYDAFLAPL